jgi:hypothetical protein
MIKLKDILSEKNVRLSPKKDASFQPGQFVQILGLKNKIKLDRKSVTTLVKFIRGSLGRELGLGPSFTMARKDKSEMNEVKVLTLPNGIKVKVEFKGLTFLPKKGKPVHLNRKEMEVFFKATRKYLK